MLIMPVRNNTALSRFELDVDGATAVVSYRLEDGVMTFFHTETPAHLQGRGIGSEVVKGALDAARSQGLKVKPRCSFVGSYIARHPETHDLLA
jgi:uncharacterized protein